MQSKYSMYSHTNMCLSACVCSLRLVHTSLPKIWIILFALCHCVAFLWLHYKLSSHICTLTHTDTSASGSRLLHVTASWTLWTPLWSLLLFYCTNTPLSVTAASCTTSSLRVDLITLPKSVKYGLCENEV